MLLYNLKFHCKNIFLNEQNKMTNTIIVASIYYTCRCSISTCKNLIMTINHISTQVYKCCNLWMSTSKYDKMWLETKRRAGKKSEGHLDALWVTIYFSNPSLTSWKWFIMQDLKSRTSFSPRTRTDSTETFTETKLDTQPHIFLNKDK